MLGLSLLPVDQTRQEEKQELEKVKRQRHELWLLCHEMYVSRLDTCQTIPDDHGYKRLEDGARVALKNFPWGSSFKTRVWAISPHFDELLVVIFSRKKGVEYTQHRPTYWSP